MHAGMDKWLSEGKPSASPSPNRTLSPPRPPPLLQGILCVVITLSITMS